MNRPLTKRAVRTALGFDTDAALADLFEISRSAVSQWEDDKAVPELRWLQLQLLRPDLFGKEVAA